MKNGLSVVFFWLSAKFIKRMMSNNLADNITKKYLKRQKQLGQISEDRELLTLSGEYKRLTREDLSSEDMKIVEEKHLKKALNESSRSEGKQFLQKMSEAIGSGHKVFDLCKILFIQAL